jgi:murein DD-endopeptidase MepM/ murein hydrolase activator NlpD
MKHKTNLHLPFIGAWFTFWGGDTEELNAHHGIVPQDFAIDFTKTDGRNRFMNGSGLNNDDYFAFGQDILAPADGIVIESCDGMRDNKPGILNNHNLLGNYIIIEHCKGEYSLLAHLKQHSVLASIGNPVKQGQKIAECGNSGHSSAPHLHFQLQSSDLFIRTGILKKEVSIAKGIKPYFTNIAITRDGNNCRENTYSPIKGDLVEN